MNLIFGIFLIIITFFFMEFVAWATHKYVMHGFLWYLHKDHHVVNKDNKFQKNDFFFLIFTPSNVKLSSPINWAWSLLTLCASSKSPFL